MLTVLFKAGDHKEKIIEGREEGRGFSGEWN